MGQVFKDIAVVGFVLNGAAAIVVFAIVFSAWSGESQTVAAWVQAVGVPATIAGTVWGGFRQRRLEDEKRQRESHQQGRRDLQKRRKALVRLHWAIETLAEDCSMPLVWLHQPFTPLHGALQQWEVALDARSKVELFDFSDVHFQLQRTVHTMLDTMKLVMQAVDRLTAETNLHGPTENVDGVLWFNRHAQLKTDFVVDQRSVMLFFHSSLRNVARDIEADIAMLQYSEYYQKDAREENVRPFSAWRLTNELEARLKMMPLASAIADGPVDAS